MYWHMQSVSAVIVVARVSVELNMTNAHHRCERFTAIKSKIITQFHIFDLRLVKFNEQYDAICHRDDTATEQPKSQRNLYNIFCGVHCLCVFIFSFFFFLKKISFYENNSRTAKAKYIEQKLFK